MYLPLYTPDAVCCAREAFESQSHCPPSTTRLRNLATHRPPPVRTWCSSRPARCDCVSRVCFGGRELLLWVSLVVVRCFGVLVVPVTSSLHVRRMCSPCSISPLLLSAMPKRKVHFLPRVDLHAASLLALTPARGRGAAASSSGSSLERAPCEIAAESATGSPTQSHEPTTLRTGRSSRPDVAQIRDHFRASVDAAENAARPELIEALNCLDRDMYASTTLGPREAVWSTCCRLHTAAFGSAVPTIPLTPH